MSDVVFIGKQALNLQSSPSYPPITKIVLIVSEELMYEAGDDSGMALEVQCPWGTQAIANDLLNSLGGYQYTPVQVEAALEPDPLWELGDPIRVNDISSQAVSMPTRFGKDYSIDIEAPTDQDIDHEYPYRSSSTRAIERTVAQASSELWVTMTSIGARVTDTEGAVSELIVSIEGIEARVEGVEETAVNTVEVQYALGDSSTTPPTTGWSPVAPAWEADKFMWQKTITTYIDGTDVESDPTCIQGANGEDGVGISSIVTEYYLSTSSTTQTGGSWSTTAPAWVSGKYIWTRSHITWDDGTTSYTTPQLDNTSNDFGSKYSSVKQTADKIEWIVASGTSATNFTLTDRAASLATGTLTLEASGSDYTGSLSVSTLSGASYGFALTSDGYYTSQNARVSSTYAVCRVTVNATEACTLTLDCINYAESTYDYGVIGKLDTVLSTSGDDSSTLIFKSFSGQSSESVVKVEIPIPAGTHFFCVKYRKDASVDQGNDAFKFRKGSPAGDSTTLTLKSGSTTLSSATITFRGFVTFTDLAESGATTINGNNITTGTISADRVDVSNLRTQTVWYYDNSNYYSILTAEISSSGTKTTTHVGAKDIVNNRDQTLYLYGTEIRCKEYANADEDYDLAINCYRREVYPTGDARWDLGTSTHSFDNIYATRLYMWDGSADDFGYFRVVSGHLRWYDGYGDYTNLT